MDDKPTLYLIPGLLCDRTIWRHQAAAFAETHDVRIPDLRNFERIDNMARAVLAEAPAHFALAGHSMGARIALEIAGAAPDRVERLALLDTGTHGVRDEEIEPRLRLVRLAEEQGMSPLIVSWLYPMVYEPLRQRSDIMKSLEAMVLANNAASFARQIDALLNRRDAQPLLAGIRAPVLIGVGRYDAWSPPVQHEAMLQSVPHARLAIFEDAGHMAPAEAPNAVIAAMRDWLFDQGRMINEEGIDAHV